MLTASRTGRRALVVKRCAVVKKFPDRPVPGSIISLESGLLYSEYVPLTEKLQTAVVTGN
jgi:hypothetical protein